MTTRFWSFSLACDAAVRASAEALLSAGELARAGRFRHDRDRRRFAVRRAMRRMILADLVGMRPDALCFQRSEHGKPYLTGTGGKIEFSCSHRGELGVLATSAGPTGIDVEPVDRQLDYLQFAERSLATEEFAVISRVDASLRQMAFFNCWTGKEAYVKALGSGLSKGLRSFAVACDPASQPGLLRDDDAPTASWHFRRYFDGNHIVSLVSGAATKTTADVDIVLHEADAASIPAGRLVFRPSDRWRAT